MKISGNMVRKRGARAQGGFTLLEVLVALAVFAIMATAAYTGLRNVLFTQAAVAEQAQRLAQLQLAFHFLEQDIQQILHRDIRNEFGIKRPAVESDGLRGDVLTFTRAGWDNPLNRQRATLQRLAYRLEEGRLSRLHWDTLDRGGISDPHETMLLDGVRELQVRFLDDSDAWQERWPPPQNQDEVPDTLPRAIELIVTLDYWGEITRLFLLLGF